MSASLFAKTALSCSLAAALAACGGGGGNALIGGTITGLANGSTLVLVNNGTDQFSITGNGANTYTFDFAGDISAGGTYSVAVVTQPLGQTCLIANASGSVDSNGDNVTGMLVSCTTTSSVAATITGLNPGAGVILSLNGSTSGLQGNGTYSFPGILTAGTTYTVGISQQPAGGQICTVSNGSVTVVANKTQVASVSCV